MKCTCCGGPLEAKNRFCPYCGNSVDAVPDASKQQEIHIHYHQEPPVERTRVEYVYVPAERKSAKNRLVAVLLCLFLGIFGVHRFYLGKIGTGLIYLLTYGLFGIGMFVDLIILLLGKPCDKQGHRLNW